MHLESVERSGAQRPIVVGDRLDTDVEGANAAGCPSLLVFTGVTDAAELLVAEPPLRPTYLAPDAGGLLVAHERPALTGGTARCGTWTARADSDGSLVLAADGEPETANSADGLDPLRVLCRVAWSLPDGTSARALTGRVRGDDGPAEGALLALGLVG
jgi:glycerol 3-phosphatase-2